MSVAARTREAAMLTMRAFDPWAHSAQTDAWTAKRFIDGGVATNYPADSSGNWPTREVNV